MTLIMTMPVVKDSHEQAIVGVDCVETTLNDLSKHM